MKSFIISFFAILISLSCMIDHKSQNFAKTLSKREEVKLLVELKPISRENSRYKEFDSVLLRFTNKGKEPISIVRPLDGSFYGWHMPHYNLELFDNKGAKLELFARCGNSGLWFDTKWPEDYVVKLFPAETFEQEIDIGHKIKVNGKYKVMFNYVYQSQKTNNLDLVYPEILWKGSVNSKPITLKLEKNYPLDN